MPLTPYVALLRAVNVGGHNAVPMPALQALLTSLGLHDVRTYIQSGNAVFRSPPTSEPELVARLEQALAQTFGGAIRVIVRSADDLAAVLQRHPLLGAGLDDKLLHVAFLAEEPSPAAVASLDPGRSPPDTFAVLGREVYLGYPQGMGKSKLTADYLERRLQTAATARNWRTVTTLAGWLAELAARR